MRILVNKAHYPVTVLGYGRRIGIWLQGCSIRCPSCCSIDTWEADEGRAMAVESLMDWCLEASSAGVDGITISGGEPFDQPDGLLSLLESLDAWKRQLDTKIDVMIYTGYSESRIRNDFPTHLSLLDVVVVGPFRESAGNKKPYCGSDNQQMLLLSQLGKARYQGDDVAIVKPGLQVAADNEGIWMIGIPRHGDLSRVERLCDEKGLALGMASWRC